MRSILVLSALLLVPGSASPQEPPPAPPADWGPMSINLEDVPYPHPVRYHLVQSRGPGRPDGATWTSPPAGHAERQERRPAARHELLRRGLDRRPSRSSARKGYRVIVHRSDRLRAIVEADPATTRSARMRSNTKRLLDHLGIKRTDIVTHSMGGMVASRFASLVSGRGREPRDDQPDRPDRRAQRAAVARDITEVYKAALARDYAEIVRGMRAYYVNWKPEYMKYVKIHYGWIAERRLAAHGDGARAAAAGDLCSTLL